MMGNVAAIERQIENHESTIDQLKEELHAAKGEQFYKCPHCTKRSKVNKLTLVRKNWYVEPYSCTGGDYWKFSEYAIICGKCDTFARVYDKSKYNDDDGMFMFVQERERAFNEVLEWYPRRDTSIDLDVLRAENKKRQGWG